MFSSGARLAGAAAMAAASSACLRSVDHVRKHAELLYVNIAHTLLGQSLLLVFLQALLSVFPLHGDIRPRLCKVQVHLPPKKVEALKVVDRILRAVHVVIDDKGLSLALKTFLRHNVDNVAELVEEFVERLLQCVDLDVLVEVTGLLCLC